LGIYSGYLPTSSKDSKDVVIAIDALRGLSLSKGQYRMQQVWWPETADFYTRKHIHVT